MKQSVLMTIAGAGLLFAGFAAGTSYADSAGKRTILARIDVAGTDKEALIGTGETGATGAYGAHSHPGEELAYVLSGNLVLKVPGKPGLKLHPGDSYTLAKGVPHDIVSTGGPARVVVVWIVDKGKPMAAPAK